MSLNNAINGSDNGLSPFSTPSHYLDKCWLTVTLIPGNKLRWNLNGNTMIWYKKMHVKMAFANWWPCCFSFNVLTDGVYWLYYWILVQCQESRTRFLSLARSKLRLCSANPMPGYWSNLCQVTEVTCPVIDRAQPELTSSKDRKRPLSCIFLVVAGSASRSGSASSGSECQTSNLHHSRRHGHGGDRQDVRIHQTRRGAKLSTGKGPGLLGG